MRLTSLGWAICSPGWRRGEPDIACLPELKAEDRAFPFADIEDTGYGAGWVGQRTWNGVAILVRGASPAVARTGPPGDLADGQARYIEAAFNGGLIGSICLPNGNPNPGPKFDDQMGWFERLLAHAASLTATGVPVVLAGDYNVVPTEADIHQPNSRAGGALVNSAARAAFRQLLDQGWLDSLRAVPPGRHALDLLVVFAKPLAERQGAAARPRVAVARLGQNSWSMPTTIVRCAATNAPATTRQLGSCSTHEQGAIPRDAGRSLSRGARSAMAAEQPRPGAG